MALTPETQQTTQTPTVYDDVDAPVLDTPSVANTIAGGVIATPSALTPEPAATIDPPTGV